jgi:DNA-directed RNA polymerase II subunit RPB7
MAGPLQLFVSREVRNYKKTTYTNANATTQLISKDIKFDPNATPWQWTDNEDQVIEKGAQVRVKLLGIRSDVGAMYAIGSIKEDYLG